MIVLDTNVVSELMKPVLDPVVRDWLSRSSDLPLITTAVTVVEIECGLQRLPAGRRKSGLLARFEDLAGLLTVLPLDQQAARAAGRLKATREAAGLGSHSSDMMIAGIVSNAGAVLATRNVRDFAHTSIQVIDPWRAP
jgi:predicted nucleic acid-binding protein